MLPEISSYDQPYEILWYEDQILIYWDGGVPLIPKSLNNSKLFLELLEWLFSIEKCIGINSQQSGSWNIWGFVTFK